MAKLITVELDLSNGDFSVDLTGFQGNGCEAISKGFQELGEVTLSTKKPEYKQKSVNLQRK